MVFELSLYDSIWIVCIAVAILVLFVTGVLKNAKRNQKIQSKDYQTFLFNHYTTELLTLYPDGVFLWNYVTGHELHNTHLVRMLNFPENSELCFEDIKEKILAVNFQGFEQAIKSLKDKGKPFALKVNYSDMTYAINGIRVNHHDGDPLFDVIMLRESSIDKKASSRRNNSEFYDKHLINLLDALPIPIWIRDQAMNIVFKNRIAEQTVIPSSGINLDTSSKPRKFLNDNIITEKNMEISEIPLTCSASQGTVGIGIPVLKRTTVDEDGTTNLEAILQSIKVAICIFNSQGSLEIFNKAFSELWGIEPDWLAAKPSMRNFLERLRDLRNLPEVPDFTLFRDTEIARVSEGISGNDMLHLPDGRTIGRRWSSDKNGGLVFSFEDLSGQLNLERSIKSLDAVQRTTIDHLTEGLAVFGQDGRLTLYNPEFCRLWGISADVLTPGTSINQLVEAMQPLLPMKDIWANPVDKIVANLLARELQSGRIDLVNGKVLQYAHIPLPDGAKLISYLDITDSSRVEEALRDRARALAEADQLKSGFIANVSYEIRTPLNTIIGFSEMLDKEYFGNLNHRQKEYTQGIVETSRSLIKVVSDIMELASIEAGFEDLDMGSIDLHALLVDNLGLARERAQRNGLKLQFDCSPSVGQIVGDSKRLSQVIFNLLSNAVSFSPRYGVVCLKGERFKNHVEISVSDSGIGIPKVDRERFLKPFEKGAGAKVGVGLGLTLARNFLNLHNGSIEISSIAPRGTLVRCTLPIDPTITNEETQQLSNSINQKDSTTN